MVDRRRPAPRRQAPRPLGLAVERLRRRMAPPTLLAAAQERWPASVGERIAEQATPVAERDAVVTVACRSAVWAAELTMLSPALLEKLNLELGEGRRVLALRFVTRPS